MIRSILIASKRIKILSQQKCWLFLCSRKVVRLMPMIRRCRFAGCHAMVEYPLHYCTAHASYEDAYQAERSKWARGNDPRRQKEYTKRVRMSEDKIEQTKFYQSKQWKGLRATVLRRDYYQCQYCKSRGRVTEAHIVDHIVPIEYMPSGMTDVKNLATICPKCHQRKSKFERDYYGTGAGNKLKSVIPIKKVADMPDFQAIE